MYDLNQKTSEKLNNFIDKTSCKKSFGGEVNRL